MTLGILWYRNLNPDNYGQLKDYLEPSAYNNETFRSCDENLYDALQALVRQSKARNERLTIPDIINQPIFPPDTQHAQTPMPDRPDLQGRREWFNGALEDIADSNVVFLNPDTGMHWTEGIEGTKTQWVYPKELQALWEMDKILVIYQHQQLFTDFVSDNTDWLRGAPLNVEHLRVYKWNPWSVRAYFIVARTENQIGWIDKRLGRLQNSRWVTKGNFLRV